MIELIWKDISVARWLLAILIPFYTLQLAVMASQPPLFWLFTAICTGLLGFGPIGLEDRQNTESLWCSLPVTRRQIVLGRYLSTCSGLILGLAMSWLVGRTVARFLVPDAGRDSVSNIGLHGYAALMIAFCLLAAVFLPCYFRFGAGKGLMVFAAIGVGALMLTPPLVQGALLLAGYANSLTDLDLWRGNMARFGTAERARLEHLAIAITGGAAGFALLFSAGLSIIFYEKRDI